MSILNKILFSMVYFTTMYVGEGEGSGEGGSGGEGSGGGGEGSGDGGSGSGGSGEGGGNKAFHETMQDPAVRDFAQTKGWQNAESVVKSAMNLEKMVGAPPEELVRIPKNGDDKAVREVYTRLGLPETPDKYEIPTIEGLPTDENYMKHMREAFHKAGAPASMVKAITEMHNDYVKNLVETSTEESKARFTAEDNDLKREWANGYDRKIKLAEGAAKELGFDEEILNHMEDRMGYAKVMKFMAGLGEKLGEDNFVNAQQQRTGFHGQMTPVEAKQAIVNMNSDPEKVNALTNKSHAAHKQVVEEKRRLFEIAYPDEK